MEKIFCVVKSKLTNFGPRSTPRPPLPNTSASVGVAKADRFQKFRMFLGPLLGLPTMSQLSCSKLALFTAESLPFQAGHWETGSNHSNPADLPTAEELVGRTRQTGTPFLTPTKWQLVQ